MSSQKSFARLKTHFESGQTRTRESRLRALEQLEAMIVENQDRICEALFADLRKPKQESLIGEVAVTLEEIRLAKRKLRRWMRPKRLSSPLALLPARSRVYYEPRGVALIIGPWNYPFMLTMVPLVGAIAAGCCAIVKPSEIASRTAHTIHALLEKYLSADLVASVLGGIPETTELLKLKTDYIFFTGSTAVGRIVMEAASKNLVPVTLELGGKSPAVVCADADLDLAARRIVWGKFYNAGQTCVAPDYVLVQESIREAFLEKLKSQISAQFGENPQKSESYARIIDAKNFLRVRGLIDPAKVSFGGKSDAADRYIQPTVLSGATWQDAAMREEIFGPVLPILTFKEPADAFTAIRLRPKPLSAYLFTRADANKRAFVEDVSFGGGCINDVLVHLGNPHLPFGGVGESGIGHYHGHASFLTFSHTKSVMFRYRTLDLSARYAPYTERKTNFLSRLFGM